MKRQLFEPFSSLSSSPPKWGHSHLMKIPITVLASTSKQPYISNILSLFCSSSVFQRKVFGSFPIINFPLSPAFSKTLYHHRSPLLSLVASTWHVFSNATDIHKSSLCEKKNHFTVFLLKATTQCNITFLYCQTSINRSWLHSSGFGFSSSLMIIKGKKTFSVRS